MGTENEEWQPAYRREARFRLMCAVGNHKGIIMTSDQIIAAASCVTAVATVVIAIYAFVSHNLSKAIQHSVTQRQREFEESTQRRHEELADLYQAIVLATMITTPERNGGFGGAIQQFRSKYKGKTPIHLD
jgi:hypothetical protein